MPEINSMEKHASKLREIFGDGVKLITTVDESGNSAVFRLDPEREPDDAIDPKKLKRVDSISVVGLPNARGLYWCFLVCDINGCRWICF